MIYQGTDENIYLDIYHHGVKGQKWGAIKEEDPSQTKKQPLYNPNNISKNTKEKPGIVDKTKAWAKTKKGKITIAIVLGTIGAITIGSLASKYSSNKKTVTPKVTPKKISTPRKTTAKKAVSATIINNGGIVNTGHDIVSGILNTHK